MSSPLLGATFVPRQNKWRARARVAGRTVLLGYFPTEAVAHDAYLAAMAAGRERDTYWDDCPASVVRVVREYVAMSVDLDHDRTRWAPLAARWLRYGLGLDGPEDIKRAMRESARYLEADCPKGQRQTDESLRGLYLARDRGSER